MSFGPRPLCPEQHVSSVSDDDANGDRLGTSLKARNKALQPTQLTKSRFENEKGIQPKGLMRVDEAT